jgi:hypothetical protein
MYQRKLSEYWRMLEPGHSNIYDFGEHLYATLQVLCSAERKTTGSRFEKEPEKLAETVKIMGVKHCVITSVDRDDLDDQGAGIWARTITEVKRVNPETRIEVLIPDFRGKEELIQQVIDAGPDVISHNLETVERLTPFVRLPRNTAAALMWCATLPKTSKLPNRALCWFGRNTRRSVANHGRPARSRLQGDDHWSVPGANGNPHAGGGVHRTGSVCRIPQDWPRKRLFVCGKFTAGKEFVPGGRACESIAKAPNSDLLKGKDFQILKMICFKKLRKVRVYFKYL